MTFATLAPGPADCLGMRVITCSPHREPSAATHPYAQPMDRAAISAQAFVRAALQARRDGYRPDVIVAHLGWGTGMFAREVFPEAAFVAYVEWWYNYPGVDTAFLAGLGGRPAESVEAPMHEASRNAPIALGLAVADAAICPTRFQADQFPPPLRRGLSVLHDGIDTGFFRPCSPADPTLGGIVPAAVPIVTFATRGMEPHRGFPQFMAALPRILADHPEAIVVIAGENQVAYGSDAARATDWKAQALATYDINPARVKFVGSLARADYLRLLQRSDAHVYLTVPFVLSWSMLEAMSVAAPLVLSDTIPVREFAGTEEAVLVGFAPADIARGVSEILSNPSAFRRTAARDRIRSTVCASREFPRKERMLSEL